MALGQKGLLDREMCCGGESLSQVCCASSPTEREERFTPLLIFSFRVHRPSSSCPFALPSPLPRWRSADYTASPNLLAPSFTRLASPPHPDDDLRPPLANEGANPVLPEDRVQLVQRASLGLPHEAPHERPREHVEPGVQGERPQRREQGEEGREGEGEEGGVQVGDADGEGHADVPDGEGEYLGGVDWGDGAVRGLGVVRRYGLGWVGAPGVV